MCQFCCFYTIKEKEVFYIKKICKILGFVVNVLGIIGATVLLGTLQTVISSSPYLEAFFEKEKIFAVLLMVCAILIPLLPAIIVGVILITMGEMLECHEFIAEKVLRLEVILKNKVIGEQNSSNEEKMENTTEKSLMWKCPKCGKENADYIGTCFCGFEKTNSLVASNLEAKLSVLSGKAETNTSVKKSTLRNTFMWKCPECGKENADYVGTCGCGFEKDNTVPKIITHSSIEEKEKVNIEPVKRSGTWRCPQCGTENTYDEEVCWCGLRNPELNV